MKYVIEIEDEPFGRNDDPVIPHGLDELYRAKGFNTLVFDQFGLDKLTPLDKLLDEIYSMGQNSVWDCIKKIASIPYAQRSDIFDGANDIVSIVQNYSSSEAIAKLREYEEQQKADVKVWDEVEDETGEKFVITYIDPSTKSVCAIGGDGHTYGFFADNYKKTGKTYPQFGELLNAMKEGAE